jgi:carboxyl-terminal processing protease
MISIIKIILFCFLLSFNWTIESNKISTTNWKLQLLKVFDIIENVYVEETIVNDQLVHGAIEGMLASLNDPYTRFLKPKNFSEMKTNLEGNFFGIGIHIGLKDNNLLVISPIEGTPAQKAGLKPFDIISSINEDSTKGISLEEAVSKIRGEKGTKVSLGIQRDGVSDNLIIDIIRDKIQIKSIKESIILTNNIGYIRLMTFESKDTYQEVKDAVAKLKNMGMEKLILDLRFNGGGLLQNALDISGLFIGNEVVVKTVARKNFEQSLISRVHHPIFQGPLALLVNGASASASEIVAGAIKDHKKGIIAGTQTFGKASVQEVIQIIDESAILLTTAKYLTPSGTNINKVGITPDIIIEIPEVIIEEMKKENYEYSIENDYQVNQVVEYLTKQNEF